MTATMDLSNLLRPRPGATDQDGFANSANDLQAPDSTWNSIQGAVPPLANQAGAGTADAPDAGAGGGNANGKIVGAISDLADYLVNGYWNWSGASNPPHHFDHSLITYNINELDPTEQTLALTALSTWADVAGVQFSFTTQSADITFKNDGPSGTAATTADVSGNTTNSATVNIASDWLAAYGSSIQSYSFQTYIHEIGHALGLGHQGPYNQTDTYTPTYGVDAIFANDTWQYSVMSYFKQFNFNGASDQFVMTPQMADIYAIQSLYGAEPTRTGDTTYGFNASPSVAGTVYDFTTFAKAPAETIYDSGGTDTLDCSGYSNNQVIDLRPGNFSDVGGLVGNIGIYLTTTIENAVGGGGSDILIGNDANNTLNGLNGDDSLNGRAGADIMEGLGGNDTYYVDNAFDQVIEGANGFDYGGNDQLYTTVSYTLAAGQDVEKLQVDTVNAPFDDIDINGNEFGQTISGNSGDNTLTGGGGADTLNGKDGADILVGGSGDDTLNGNDGADILKGGGGADHLDGGAGVDTADYSDSPGGINVTLNGGFSADGYGTPDTLVNIENVQGSPHDDVITGNAGDNALSGNSGNDVLRGGAGADALDGGAGSDTASYELATAGVHASLATPGANTGEAHGDTYVSIENLLGSSFNDILVGNSGANTLSGGAGGDTLKGGGGGDHLDGGAGIDTASYGDSTVGVGVDLAAGTGSGGSAQGDTLVNIENLTGSSYNDTLAGDGNANTLLGEAGNDLLKGGGGADVLDGGAGEDTASYGSSAAGVHVDLAVNTANGGDSNGDSLVNIEDLIGSAQADTLTGNDLDNRLSGGGGNDALNGGNGNDTLDGGVGADVMEGGAGADSYFVDNAGDVVYEAPGGGNDEVFTSVSYTLFAGQEIENFTTTGSNTANINLTGNALAQTITGNAGNNILDDGGAGSADSLFGLDGNDSYIVNNAGDVVLEVNPAGGNDHVLTSVSYTLGASQSIEDFTPTSFGSTTNINLTGNTLSQSIYGNAGNNTLNDGGAGGADMMEGLGGDDVYIVNNTGDIVGEAANQGSDHVLTSVSYTLGANASIENFTPTSFATTTNINLTGNALAQSITGNAGNNIISDGGAGGADTMKGLGGDDSYIVNNTADVVAEGVGAGSDHVLASVSYSLAAGASIENFTPTSFGSTTNINLTGNTFSQSIYGNAGNNILDDGGAGGADTMEGLGGDDAYIVNNTADTVLEAVGTGKDHVLASVSYTLGAGAEIENLTPTSFATTTNINLTGNAFAQSITGNAGANVISGGGGNDTLEGLGGNDTFYFNSPLNGAGNVDSILDFVHGTDKIELDHAIFTALAAANPLPAADFTTGAPTNTSQHIIYNATTGALSYDDDGNGAHAAVQFATLTNHPTLTNTDIFVV